jgi:alpha-D-xyloside xylohydrolase
VPEGRWTNFFSSEVIEGGRWRRESIDFMHVPLLVRENTVLPIGGDAEKPNWKSSDELTLQLFQIADGADVSISVPATDGPHPMVFRCQRTGAKFALSCDGRAKDVKVQLPPRRFVGEISNGKPCGSAPEAPLISWTDTAKPLTFSLKN